MNEGTRDEPKHNGPADPAAVAAQRRRERLAVALRANLHRRKDQARARKDGLAASDDDETAAT